MGGLSNRETFLLQALRPAGTVTLRFGPLPCYIHVRDLYHESWDRLMQGETGMASPESKGILQALPP